MRRGLVASVVGVVACAGVAGLVVWSPWSQTADGHLKDTIDVYQGATYVPPPQPQSGLHVVEVPIPTAGSGPTQETIAQAWAGMESAASEGKWKAWAYVADGDTGEVIFEADSGTPHTPASITKILTADFALWALDGKNTLATGVSYADNSLYLWGEGDLLLSAGVGNSTAIAGRAGLADLAAKTAKELSERKVSEVALTYQDSLFQGDKRLPAWAAQEVTDFAGDTTSFAIETGRIAPGEWAFVDDSAAVVAAEFASRLQEAGITVTSTQPGSSIAGATQIAEVHSAPITEQIMYMLHHSDNTMAEQLCKLAAQAQGAETTFAGATSAVIDHVASLGIDTAGLYLDDCSGLSENDKIAPRQLGEVLKQSRNLLQMLPRAGIDGTLHDRLDQAQTFGNLQAKTGSLGSVSSLAGLVTSADGKTLIFAVGADGVPDEGAYWVKPYIDQFVSALAG